MVFTIEWKVVVAVILKWVSTGIPEPVSSKYLATFLRLLYSRRGWGFTLVSLGEQVTLAATS